MKNLKKLVGLGVLTCITITSVSAFGATQINSEDACDTCKTLELIQDRNVGSWFGDVSEDFTIYIPSGEEMQTASNITSILISATVPFIPSKVAGSFLNATGAYLGSLKFDDYPARTYYGTVEKRYREVEVGGEFSHYETMFIINIYNDSSHTDYVYRDTEIYEGQMLMNEF